MNITGSRIINVGRYIGHLPDQANLCVVTDVTNTKAGALAKAGFSEDGKIGQTVLPAIVGPMTRFNAEGRWIVHRDQPKETRYVGTRVWRWTQWGGEEQERYTDIERECYPRTRVPPPSIELSIQERNGRLLIVSPQVKKSDGEKAKHIINIFLELFRTCDVSSTDLESYSPPTIHRVNWRLLPPGEYPWDKMAVHIATALKRASKDVSEIIQDRQDTIRSYGPSRVFVGQAGFSDYLAYEFSDRNQVVLESIRRDNAIYIFGHDWQSVSQLSKADIIKEDLHKHRIVHSRGWKDRLASALV